MNLMCNLYRQICLVKEFMEAEKHYKSEVISQCLLADS